MIAKGQRVRFVPNFNIDKIGKDRLCEMKKVTGTIVYVNEAHSYFTAEYDVQGYKMRESFKFSEYGEAVTPCG